MRHRNGASLRESTVRGRRSTRRTVTLNLYNGRPTFDHRLIEHRANAANNRSDRLFLHPGGGELRWASPAASCSTASGRHEKQTRLTIDDFDCASMVRARAGRVRLDGDQRRRRDAFIEGDAPVLDSVKRKRHVTMRDAYSIQRAADRAIVDSRNRRLARGEASKHLIAQLAILFTATRDDDAGSCRDRRQGVLGLTRWIGGRAAASETRGTARLWRRWRSILHIMPPTSRLGSRRARHPPRRLHRQSPGRSQPECRAALRLAP